MKLTDNRWPTPEEWLGWSAEARDAHASRCESHQTLWAQQADRVKALIVDWRAYRAANPPHPQWRANRASLVAEVTAHEASVRARRRAER